MKFNDILAWFLTGCIILFWFVVVFADLTSNDLAMMVVGATISAFTIIVQFYFRKRSGGD